MVKFLRETRIEKGLTLRDLTEEMGVSYSHLSRAERGLSQPGLVVLLRWCRALDFPFGHLWEIASED
ncbi:helix-turn-helix domain-containing protein [Luteolibacter yonseiensis]